MKIKNILIGSDPEVMLVREIEGKEVLYPSFLAKIPGTKRKPSDIGEGCAIQVDNVMAEFCIPATDSPENMFKAIKYCIDHIEKKYKVKVKPGSSGSYPPQYLKHPIAQAFGCDPDFNAWTLSENMGP